jgi:hypothetical protein
MNRTSLVLDISAHGQFIDLAAHYSPILDVLDSQIRYIHCESMGIYEQGALNPGFIYVNTCLWPCFLPQYYPLSMLRFHSGYIFDNRQTHTTHANACKLEEAELDAYGDIKFSDVFTVLTVHGLRLTEFLGIGLAIMIFTL